MFVPVSQLSEIPEHCIPLDRTDTLYAVDTHPLMLRMQYFTKFAKSTVLRDCTEAAAIPVQCSVYYFPGN